MTSPIVVTYGSATHAGLRRRVNEDALLAVPPLFLVADGMGGHDAGAAASGIVVEVFGELAGAESLGIDDIDAALDRARRRVQGLAAAERAAGTTLSGVVIADVGGAGYWLTVNVGDSRVYRLAGTRFERLTIDHSYVQEQLDAGLITQDEADNFEHKNVITRAVGAPDSPPDYWVHPVEPGERLLICSDGLHGEVPDDELYEVLASYPEPSSAVERLIDLAGTLDPYALAPEDWQAQSLVLLLRSLVVDLLEAAGASPQDARAALPEL